MYNPFSSGVSAVKFTFSALVAGVFGYFTSFLGGFDTLLSTLLVLIAVDYLTGVICAAYEKKLSSEIGFKGIIKKILMILIVGVAVTLQRILPQGVPLREITILFFICNEGLSVLENTARIIPLPQKLKDVLLQLKEESEKDDNDKEK
ncbi:MAG: phage holin family protein [Ruminococcaceae bacterium]|nr:phage holin family protein [Oscillospiraceae bacterium]